MKETPGGPRCSWVDNIMMDLQEDGRCYRDWIRLAYNREKWQTLLGALMNIRVP